MINLIKKYFQDKKENKKRLSYLKNQVKHALDMINHSRQYDDYQEGGDDYEYHQNYIRIYNKALDELNLFKEKINK